MMVYEQITLKKRKVFFQNLFFGSNIEFLIEKSISGLKKQEKTKNIPRISIKTRGFLLKPEDSYENPLGAARPKN